MTDENGQSERIAILVIHGMGEQAPYQTLDGFARGLAGALRKALSLNGKTLSYDIKLSPINRVDPGGGWTEARIALDPAKPDSKKEAAAELTGLPHITVAEYYWSPKAENKMPWLDSLKWLAQSDLSPLEHMAANVQEIWDDLNVAHGAKWKRSIAVWRAGKILAKEVTRTLCIYIPLLFVVYGMLQWLGGGLSMFIPQVAAYQSQVNDWLTLRHILLASLGVVVLDLAYFLFTEIVPNLWRKATGESSGQSLRSQNDMVRFSRRVWIRTALILTVVFAVAFFLVNRYLTCAFWTTHILHWLLWLPKLPALWLVNHPASFWKHLPALARTTLAALGAIVLRNFLANYLGKVAIYVNTDANSSNYAIRSAILQGSCSALNNLLNTNKKEPPYNRVYVAAHSLGTAIALDTINELFNRAEAYTTKAMKEDMQHLRGLLTFGSPLNKFWYFFRQQTQPDEAIRAQILSRLHSFRRVSSRRDYDPYDFSPRERRSTEPENPEPASKDFLWVNVFARMDIFTGRLRFDPNISNCQARLLPTVPVGLPKESLTLKPSHDGFYWVDRQYKGKWWRYWKPVLAHNTYWDDPCLYERFLADFKIL